MKRTTLDQNDEADVWEEAFQWEEDTLEEEAWVPYGSGRTPFDSPISSSSKLKLDCRSVDSPTEASSCSSGLSFASTVKTRPFQCKKLRKNPGGGADRKYLDDSSLDDSTFTLCRISSARRRSLDFTPSLPPPIEPITQFPEWMLLEKEFGISCPELGFTDFDDFEQDMDKVTPWRAEQGKNNDPPPCERKISPKINEMMRPAQGVLPWPDWNAEPPLSFEMMENVDKKLNLPSQQLNQNFQTMESSAVSWPRNAVFVRHKSKRWWPSPVARRPKRGECSK
jgi:hypothetical protein